METARFTFHLVAIIGLLLTFVRFGWAQFAYKDDYYAGYSGYHYDCSKNGADQGSWQCYLCGDYTTWPAQTQCLANYTNFDRQSTYSLAKARTTYLVYWTVTNSSRSPAIQSYSGANHAECQSPNVIDFKTGFESEPAGFGRLHAFAYACSDGAGSAVACNVTWTVWFVNYTGSYTYPQPLKKATQTMSYTPASIKGAPMKIGNLTNLSEKNYQVTKNWTVEKFAVSYFFSATNATGAHVWLHIDNLESTWWFAN